MSAASVLVRGRVAIERLMVDECLIRRKTGETTDPDTGQVTPTYAQVYAGKCRFQYRGLSTGSPNVGQQRVDMFALELQLPIVVTDVRVNDVITATTSLDPDLPGRVFRVNNIAHKTHFTSRRLPLEEITS